jgi:hypothetical protein
LENASSPYSLLTYTLKKEAEYSSDAVLPISSATCCQHRPQYAATFAFLATCATYNGSLGVNGSMILKWILREIGCKGVDRMYMPEDKGKWSDLVNIIKKFEFRKVM